MPLADLIDWQEVSLAGLLALLSIVLVFAWVGREKKFSKVKVGFFVERERDDDHEAFNRWLVDWIEAQPPLLEPPDAKPD